MDAPSDGASNAPLSVRTPPPSPPPRPPPSLVEAKTAARDAILSTAELRQLETLSRDTTIKLHAVWDEMGQSEEERALQLASLVEQVQNVFVNKVADEVALRDEYANAAAALDAEFSEVSAQLSQARPHFPATSNNSSTGGGNLMQRLTWLRTNLAEFNKTKATRMAKLQDMHSKLRAIWLQMGEPEQPRFTALEGFLSEAGLREYEARLAEATRDKTRRIAAVQDLVRDVNALFEELEFAVEDEIDQAVAAGGDGLGIDEDAVGILSQRARELTDEKIARTQRLKLLGSQIQPLWDKLDVDTDTRQRFFADNRGLGRRVIEQCELELARLQDLKKARMGDLVRSVQEAISGLWEEMQYDEAARDGFMSTHWHAPVCEETLQAHEEEMAVLSTQAELYRPILRLIDKYAQLCDERLDYEAKIQDSSRLLSRRNGKLLQEEEQQRKRVVLGIPRTMDKVRAAVADYEALHGPFVISGRRFVESMDENEEAHSRDLADAKERKKKEKEDLAPPTALMGPGMAHLGMGNAGNRTPGRGKLGGGAGTPGTVGSARSRAPLGSRTDNN